MRDSITVDFLREFLPEASGHRPKPGERIRDWDSRPMPSHIIALRDIVHKSIVDRLRDIAERRAADRAEQAEQEASEILTRNSLRVEKFVGIAYLKVVKPDEYGDENPEALGDEIHRFMDKLAKSEVTLRTSILRTNDPDGIALARAVSRKLSDHFEQYYRKRKQTAGQYDAAAIASLTGVQFEAYLAETLRSLGLSDVSSTPHSGDQGADLLFSHNGKKFVIQAKRYTSIVGNKAIQEAHAAMGFYGCDSAWVVTNSRFTSAARALAKQLNVVLVDGGPLGDFRSFVTSEIGIDEPDEERKAKVERFKARVAQAAKLSGERTNVDLDQMRNPTTQEKPTSRGEHRAHTPSPPPCISPRSVDTKGEPDDTV